MKLKQDQDKDTAKNTWFQNSNYFRQVSTQLSPQTPQKSSIQRKCNMYTKPRKFSNCAWYCSGMLPTMIVCQFDVVAHNGLILLSPPFAICIYWYTGYHKLHTKQKSHIFDQNITFGDGRIFQRCDYDASRDDCCDDDRRGISLNICSSSKWQLLGGATADEKDNAWNDWFG